MLKFIYELLKLYFKENNKEDIINKQQNNTQPKQITSEFKDGVNQTWAIVQLSLYKMYKNNDILDCDSLFKEILNNANSLLENVQDLKKWNEEYIHYLEENLNNQEGFDT